MRADPRTLRVPARRTYVGSTVSDLLRPGPGVCQDFVHLSLVLLRRRGIAARYVSGYLWAAARGRGSDSLEVDTHAWLEALLPGSDGHGEPVWVSADPTNRRLAGETHVKIGHGRFYADVAARQGPLHGRRHLRAERRRDDVAAGPADERPGAKTAAELPLSRGRRRRTFGVNAYGACAMPLHSSSHRVPPAAARPVAVDRPEREAGEVVAARSRGSSGSPARVTVSRRFVGLAVHRRDARVFVGRGDGEVVGRGEVGGETFQRLRSRRVPCLSAGAPKSNGMTVQTLGRKPSSRRRRRSGCARRFGAGFAPCPT